MKKNYHYLILIVLLVITFITIVVPPRVYQTSPNGKSLFATEIKKDDVYESLFTTPLKNIDKIGIRFSTYQYNNKHGSIIISLYGNDTLIKEKIIQLKNVEDNSIVYLKFKQQANSLKTNYKLVIKYNEYYDDNRLATWYSTSSNEDNYVLYNGERQLNTLYYELSGKGKVKDFLLYDLLLISLWIVWFSCNGGKHEKNKK